jgi:heptosyltransferase-1
MTNLSFLIVKTSAIGDILHTLDVAQYLKQRFPQCSIAWVVDEKFKDLVKASPYVDEAIGVNMKCFKKKPLQLLFSFFSVKRLLGKKTYDVAFDLQGNSKSAAILLLIKAKDKVGFGRKSVFEWPNLLATRTKINIDMSLQVSKQYLSLVKSYFQDEEKTVLLPHLLKIGEGKIPEAFSQREEKPQVMVCPGSNWVNKQLSEATLLSFLQEIEKKYHPVFVFIWGNLEEKKLAIRLQQHFPDSKITGALSLAVWQALMQSMDCVISVDSCALHLAALAHVSTLSIYGPSSSKIYKPEGDKHLAYQGACPYQQAFTRRCKKLRTCKTGACMKNISSYSLAEAFEQLWEKHSCK